MQAQSHGTHRALADTCEMHTCGGTDVGLFVLHGMTQYHRRLYGTVGTYLPFAQRCRKSVHAEARRNSPLWSGLLAAVRISLAQAMVAGVACGMGAGSRKRTPNLAVRGAGDAVRNRAGFCLLASSMGAPIVKRTCSFREFTVKGVLMSSAASVILVCSMRASLRAALSATVPGPCMLAESALQPG